MDIRTSGIDALKTSMANPYRAWQGKATAARDRLAANGYFDCYHKPKFSLNKAQRVFTIGSCFAREIENKLASMGVKVILAGKGVQRKYFESWTSGPDAPGATDLSAGVFNKYTVSSIWHDVRRTLRNEDYVNEGLIELAADRWFDPHASGLRLQPLSVALENRAVIREGLAELKDSDVVFITLGQTESWVDADSGLSMNSHPGPIWLKKFGKRFEFVDESFDATFAQLRATVELIRELCGADIKFIVTVSPVPFNATFRGDDVVVSHTATKAKLRTVAEELARTYEFVDYFPSYEIVVNTPRALAWMDDGMHVNSKMVDHVMTTFVASSFVD